MANNLCTDCVAQGAFSKLIVEPGASPHTFDANSERYEFLGETLTTFQRLEISQGITGDLGQLASRVYEGATLVMGSLYLNPSPQYMANWLPRMIGPLDVATYKPTACLEQFGIMLQRDLEYEFELTDCRVARWVLEGKRLGSIRQAEPNFLILRLDILGLTEVWDAVDDWPSPEPSLGTTDPYTPYLFEHSDSGITLAGSTRAVEWFRLTVDHGLAPRWRNSLTPKSVCSNGRAVHLDARVDWNDANDDLYSQTIAGAAGSLALTIENMSTTFSFGNLKQQKESPTVRNKFSDILLPFNGRAFQTVIGTPDDITAVNDATN